MRVLQSIEELASVPGPVALAIGVFDGVHLGHQEVIRAACEHARQHAGTPVVVTFDPHPLQVLRPQAAPRMLSGPRHQQRLLEALGVPCMLVCRFDAELAATPARQFVTRLAEAAQPLGCISVGYSWSFGKGREGNIHLLTDLGQELGFAVYGVPPVREAGEVVSSTAIREAVTQGELEKAALLLGRRYAVYGTVQPGQQLGRQLGFPTANVEVESEQLPPLGVYAAQAKLVDEWLPAVVNLGRRPTVAADAEPSLEVHLLDWSGDCYLQEMEVRFVKHLRSEKKFSSLEELKMQIARDVAATRACL
jgi:riboflavin kinase / FMN adenylyltransferase